MALVGETNPFIILGGLFLIAGIVLVLAGTKIVKIENPFVVGAGRNTLIAGILLGVVGAIILFAEYAGPGPDVTGTGGRLAEVPPAATRTIPAREFTAPPAATAILFRTATPTVTMTPQPSATPSPSSTPPPSPTPLPAISIVDVVPSDIAGENSLAEYVKIRNDGPTAIDLSGWTLEDSLGRDAYDFHDFILAEGASVRVWTGTGTNGPADLYANRGQAIWNDDGDTVLLIDGAGVVIDEYTYPREP